MENNNPVVQTLISVLFLMYALFLAADILIKDIYYRVRNRAGKAASNIFNHAYKSTALMTYSAWEKPAELLWSSSMEMFCD